MDKEYVKMNPFDLIKDMAGKGPEELGKWVDVLSEYWYSKRKETRSALELLMSDEVLNKVSGLQSKDYADAANSAILLGKVLIDALLIVQNTKDVKDKANLALIHGCSEMDKAYVVILRDWCSENKELQKGDLRMKLAEALFGCHDRMLEPVTDMWSRKIKDVYDDNKILVSE